MKLVTKFRCDFCGGTKEVYVELPDNKRREQWVAIDARCNKCGEITTKTAPMAAWRILARLAAGGHPI